MRPIRMTVSAFGPFAEETEIDFSKLGDSGLYLVTGDTGAGKTTIFDAIVYALYGEASGEGRQGSMFRSKYAKLETRTFVELEFACNNQIYVVSRNPGYTRQRLKGTGTATQKSDARLVFQDDRQPVTGLLEVTKKITEIIGLDRNQFTQIVMLAQGEFQKFLMASTEEKETIFRNIFHTQNYQELQTKLKDRGGQLKNEYEDYENQISRLIKNVTCGEESAFSEELTSLQGQQELVNQEEFAHLLEQLLAEQKTALQQLDKEMKDREKQLATLNEQIGVAVNLQGAKEELTRIETFLKAGQQELAKLVETKKKAVEAAGACDELTAKVAQVQQKLGDYAHLTKLSKQQETTKKEYETGEQTLAQYEKSVKENQEKILQLQAVTEEKKDCGKLRLSMAHRLEEISRQKKEMEDFQSLFGQFEKQQQQVEKQQQLCRKKLAEYEELSREYNHLYQGFIRSQAGILAQSLQEGDPCPVCGAVSHPKPAELSEEICTREELEKKKEKVDKKDQEAREQGLKAEGLLTTCNAMRQQLAEKADALLGEGELEAVKPLLEERLSKLLEEKEKGEKELTDYQQGEEAYEEAQKQLPVLSESQKEMENAVAKQRELQTGRAKDLEHLEENLESLKKELIYKNEEEALAAIEEWNRQKENLQKAKDTAEKAVADYDKEIAAKRAKQQTLEEQLRENQTKPYEELIKQRQDLQSDKQRIQAKRDHLYRRCENNQESGRQALEMWEKLTQVEERYVSMKNLSDTVNGNLSGKNRIMLETYVQMTYFDLILNQANVRLLSMTDGQYELVRKRGASNQKSQSGLELEVWDHYTSSLRSVHTLSGGESFMASLALALGLSDEIQMKAGGIRLDTMFVDEGFGSLDEETLSKAIDVLAGLTEGNRLVGIISHVEELKQRIDKQIVVTKDAATGSRVEVSI